MHVRFRYLTLTLTLLHYVLLAPYKRQAYTIMPDSGLAQRHERHRTPPSLPAPALPATPPKRKKAWERVTCSYQLQNRSPVEAELLRVEQIHHLAEVLHHFVHANRAIFTRTFSSKYNIYDYVVVSNFYSACMQQQSDCRTNYFR